MRGMSRKVYRWIGQLLLVGLGGVGSLMVMGCGQATEDPGLQVWAIPSTVKVHRSELPPARSDTIHLSAAQDETEGFQLVLHAALTQAQAVTIRVSPLVHSDGHALPDSAIALFREHYHLVLQPTGGYRWQRPAEYPDALLPFTAPEDGQPYGAPFAITRIGATGKPHIHGRQDHGFMFATGTYTGTENRAWVVQVVKGGPPGQATIRWSDQWKSGWDDDVRVKRWSAEDILIPAASDAALIPEIALKDGVAIRFTGETFVAGETYHVHTYARINQVIWGDISVPAQAQPGTYTGSVDVVVDGALLKTLPLSLDVWPFALPKPRTMTTAFHGWMDAQFYADNPAADWQFELLLHAHGIDLQTIHGQHTVWGGNPEQIDWTAFDQAARPRLDGSVYPDGVPIKQFHLGMYGCGNEWHWEKQAGQSESRVEQFASAFAKHLKAQGWFDRVYVYCRDEPSPQHIPGIVRDIRAFLRADPDWRGKFMITSAPREASPLLDLIDIWCVKYHWWIDPALRSRLRQEGRTFWTYVANTPHTPNPTYHIDARRGYEPRLIKWASWLQGSDGFLYWAAVLDQRYPNPWITTMNDFGANGDANLVYYGARNGPHAPDQGTPLRPINAALPSFRLKQIRDGLDDWDLFNLAAERVGREQVEILVRQAYRAPGGAYGENVSDRKLEEAWTQDPERIVQIRREVAALVWASDPGLADQMKLME